MKTLLVKISLVLLTTLLCCCLAIGIKMHLDWHRVEELYTIDESCHVLVLGSSDAGCSFIEGGRYGMRVFWNSGSSFLFNAMRLRAIEKVNGGLKNVKVVVAPFNQHYPSWYRDEMRTLRTFRTLLPSVWMYWGEMPGEYKLKSLANIFQELEYTGGMHESVPGETSPWSERPVDVRKPYLESQWKDHYGWLNWADAEIKAINVRIKNDIARLKEDCDRLGVKLVLVVTPFTSDYWEGVPKEALDWLDNIEKFSSTLGIAFYDLKKSMPDNKFRDNCHLVLSGSSRFTEMVFEKLEKDKLLK